MSVRKIFFSAILIVAGSTMVVGWWFFSDHFPEGVTRRVQILHDREISFLIIPVPETVLIELVADMANPHSVQTWREQTGADIVINGSYFMETNEPSGYWKRTGEASVITWPTAEEQADKVGYTFLLDVASGKLGLHYLPDEPQEEPKGDAFLSFPTLLVDGKSMVERDSGLLARRTVVASTEDKTYLIVTEKGELSLYELAAWLDEQPENFLIAGNLDGGPSTGISMENGYHDIEVRSAEVPNVLVVDTKHRP